MTTKKSTTASVWDCRVCVDQMMGGPRCWTHNPSPDDDRPRIKTTTMEKPK